MGSGLSCILPLHVQTLAHRIPRGHLPRYLSRRPSRADLRADRGQADRGQVSPVSPPPISQTAGVFQREGIAVPIGETRQERPAPGYLPDPLHPGQIWRHT